MKIYGGGIGGRYIQNFLSPSGIGGDLDFNLNLNFIDFIICECGKFLL